jgi:hypothetical protein
MSGTARLALPFLSPGQAQKEFTHNEALQQLDIVVAAGVEEGPRTDPPASPAVGACYLVGLPAAGDWTGQDHCLACFSSGGWRFIRPLEGMTAFVKDAAIFATYLAGNWETGVLRGSSLQIGGIQVVGPRATAIAEPGGGSIIDEEVRGTVGQILVALRHHGLIGT